MTTESTEIKLLQHMRSDDADTMAEISTTYDMIMTIEIEPQNFLRQALLRIPSRT